MNEGSITQLSRTFLLLVLAYLLNRSNTEYVDYDKENSQLLNKVVTECVDSTPLWFRKYKDADKSGICNAPTKKRLYIAKPTAIHGIKARANMMNSTIDSSRGYATFTPL